MESAEHITFLGAPSARAAKRWTPGADGAPECQPYSIGAGPFEARTIAVADLAGLAALVSACPPTAYAVRGAPTGPTIPYRRHRAQDGQPATLLPAEHRWLAVDIDAPGPVPRTDLEAMASEARESLGTVFARARCFAQATSSAGIVPGIRVRLWFWCDRLVSDKHAQALLANTPADLRIYTPSQPCYCAAPMFEGVPDPFEGRARHAWLDGEPELRVPDTRDAGVGAAHVTAPLEGFGRAAAGAVVGNRNAHLASLAGALRRRGMGEDAIRAALEAANGELAEPLPAAEVAAVARSIARYAPAIPVGEPSAPDTVAPPVDTAWSATAIINDEGGLVPCAENYALLLRGHGAFRLWLNSRTGRPVWERCPWRSSAAPVADGDDFQMRCWLSRHLGWHKMPCDLLAGIAEVAADRAHDPWRGYLEQLAWDGRERLSSAAERLLGAGTEAASATFAWWLVSAVARSFRPGVQADHMIVLEGEQGLGKTTFLRELAMHEAFFTRLSAHSDLSNVRTIGKIHGPVIVELAELDTVRRAGVEAMKAFVDERHDRVQWLYARSQVDVARSCVFAGTANDSDYLKDTTGNRRYWPISCQRIDLDALRAEREQLWAEAVAAYRAGIPWWPTNGAAAELGLAELQESRRAPSAAEETIAAALEGTYQAGMHVLTGVTFAAEQLAPAGRLAWVTTAQLCTLARCKDFEAQAAMRALKWNPARVRMLTGRRIRAYIRP